MIVPVQRFERVEGVSATRRLLATGARPDAIFAFNDVLAFGVLRALYEAGMHVPDDVAVVGFDDVEEGQFSQPTLTTISPDKQQIARCAVANLIERMNGGADAPPRDVVVPHSLVPRRARSAFALRDSRSSRGKRASKTAGGPDLGAASGDLLSPGRVVDAYRCAPPGRSVVHRPAPAVRRRNFRRPANARRARMRPSTRTGGCSSQAGLLDFVPQRPAGQLALPESS